jgi:hypothetical protein
MKCLLSHSPSDCLCAAAVHSDDLAESLKRASVSSTTSNSGSAKAVSYGDGTSAAITNLRHDTSNTIHAMP